MQSQYEDEDIRGAQNTIWQILIGMEWLTNCVKRMLIGRSLKGPKGNIQNEIQEKPEISSKLKRLYNIQRNSERFEEIWIHSKEIEIFR